MLRAISLLYDTRITPKTEKSRCDIYIVECKVELTAERKQRPWFSTQWPLLFAWSNFNPSMDKYIHYNAWDEITHPFPDFNDWISNFIPHFTRHVII